MGYYSRFLHVDQFLFSLHNDNKKFMQRALMMGAFDKQIFKEDDVINFMLTCLEDGSKTNYILNVLLLSDVTLWKNKYLKLLIEAF
jgi:hypothetical protein